MGLFWLDPCHLYAVCLCNMCLLSMSPMFVCLSSGHHVCLSVTKRHKAHLKRLDRRWTLGGVISRQQSRGELRQMLYHLPPSFCYCSQQQQSQLIYCLLSHGSTCPSPHKHNCSVLHPVLSYSKCIYHEPQSTTTYY